MFLPLRLMNVCLHSYLPAVASASLLHARRGCGKAVLCCSAMRAKDRERGGKECGASVSWPRAKSKSKKTNEKRVVTNGYDSTIISAVFYGDEKDPAYIFFVRKRAVQIEREDCLCGPVPDFWSVHKSESVFPRKKASTNLSFCFCLFRGRQKQRLPAFMCNGTDTAVKKPYTGFRICPIRKAFSHL